MSECYVSARAIFVRESLIFVKISRQKNGYSGEVTPHDWLGAGTFSSHESQCLAGRFLQEHRWRSYCPVMSGIDLS